MRRSSTFSPSRAETNSSSTLLPSRRALTVRRRGGVGLARFLLLGEDGQGLFAGGGQAVGGRGVPADAGGEGAKEGVHLLGRVVVQGHAQAAATGLAELDEGRQRYGDDGAGGHAVAEEDAHESFAQQFGEDDAVLEPDTDPEGDAGDGGLAVVEAVLDDDPQTLDEKQGDEDAHVGGGHGRRDGDEEGRCLGEEGQDDKNDADHNADATGGDAGDLGEGDARGVGGVGQRAGEAGQEVAHAVGVEGALNDTVVGGSGTAAGNALDGDAVADGLDGADEGDDDEGGQEGPELHAGGEVEAGPGAEGHADPGGILDVLDVVHAEGADTAQPTIIPATGDHNRHDAGARRTRTTTTRMVTTATRGGAAEAVPSGASLSMSNTMGMMVAAMSMITVPETTGVKMLRSTERRAARANWNRADTTTRLAMRAGPPWMRAAAHTAKNAPDVPIIRMCPAPMRQRRADWRMVVIPLMRRAAKTPQAM